MVLSRVYCIAVNVFAFVPRKGQHVTDLLQRELDECMRVIMSRVQSVKILNFLYIIEQTTNHRTHS